MATVQNNTVVVLQTPGSQPPIPLKTDSILMLEKGGGGRRVWRRGRMVKEVEGGGWRWNEKGGGGRRRE